MSHCFHNLPLILTNDSMEIENESLHLTALPNELFDPILYQMKIENMLKMHNVSRNFKILTRHYHCAHPKGYDKILFDFDSSDFGVIRSTDKIMIVRGFTK